MSVQTIPLRRRDGTFRYALVDSTDYARVGRVTWCFDGYVRRRTVVDGKRRTVYLHREILGLTFGVDGKSTVHVDHINGNTLDNRRSNLRTATQGQNNQNRWRMRPDNRSGYRGVFFRDGKWVACVSIAGRRHWVGSFTDPHTAGAAVSAYRRAHMPYALEERAA
jgi:hypothetical protein